MAKGASEFRERFQITREIGEGGFARVYEGKEPASGRRVAIKVLKDDYLRDTEILERFRREVFAVASIDSPHVVKMYDFGISGDEVFIAMEFVEGPTLRELIYERTWRTEEVHLVIGQIAQALAAAHRQQIVHRDLKPENVMLVAAPNGSRVVKVSTPTDSREAGASGVRRGKMQSAWLKSVSEMDTLPAAHPPSAKPAPKAVPATAEVPVRSFAERTEILKKPPNARGITWWLVPLLVALVAFAASLGYFLGQRAR